jgi:hypothetical protein
MIPELLPYFPARPYCTNDPKTGLKIRSKTEALKYSHVSINVPWETSVLLFDVDFEQAGASWLPIGYIPTWTTRNPINGHCHLAYMLETPVLTGEDSSPKAKRFLKDTLILMREALEADTHYPGLITKNPCASWQWGVNFSGILYALHDLNRASKQNISVSRADELLKPKKQAVDHVSTPLAEAGRGERNDTLFNELRAWAYQEIRNFRGEKRIFSDFLRSCANEVEIMNSIIPESLSSREAFKVAESVAKWTFKHDPLAQEQFRAKQAARGKKSGVVRRVGSLEEAKPWEAEGITKQAWYKRQNPPHAKPEKWIAISKPWDGLPYSKRTYYRKLKAGLIDRWGNEI